MQRAVLAHILIAVMLAGSLPIRIEVRSPSSPPPRGGVGLSEPTAKPTCESSCCCPGLSTGSAGCCCCSGQADSSIGRNPPSSPEPITAEPRLAFRARCGPPPEWLSHMGGLPPAPLSESVLLPTGAELCVKLPTAGRPLPTPTDREPPTPPPRA